MISGMFEPESDSHLSEIEEELKRRFNKESADKRRLPSTAAAARSSDRIDQLVLPDEMRPKMPFTKDKYIVREDPHLVQWEREVRKFCRRLSPDHEHRVSATMVYEWATGIPVKKAMELAKDQPKQRGRRTWRSDLNKITQCLTFYFGEPRTTSIMGRKIGKAFRVKPGYYIRHHRPMTLTLYAEYVEGVLYP